MKLQHNMIIGAVAGDCIGSVFEFDNIKSTEFELFCSGSCLTDDSVLTIATMSANIIKRVAPELPDVLKTFSGRYADW